MDPSKPRPSARAGANKNGQGRPSDNLRGQRTLLAPDMAAEHVRSPSTGKENRHGEKKNQDLGMQGGPIDKPPQENCREEEQDFDDTEGHSHNEQIQPNGAEQPPTGPIGKLGSPNANMSQAQHATQEPHNTPQKTPGPEAGQMQSARKLASPPSRRWADMADADEGGHGLDAKDFPPLHESEEKKRQGKGAYTVAQASPAAIKRLAEHPNTLSLQQLFKNSPPVRGKNPARDTPPLRARNANPTLYHANEEWVSQRQKDEKISELDAITEQTRRGKGAQPPTTTSGRSWGGKGKGEKGGRQFPAQTTPNDSLQATGLPEHMFEVICDLQGEVMQLRDIVQERRWQEAHRTDLHRSEYADTDDVNYLRRQAEGSYKGKGGSRGSAHRAIGSNAREPTTCSQAPTQISGGGRSDAEIRGRRVETIIALLESDELDGDDDTKDVLRKRLQDVLQEHELELRTERPPEVKREQPPPAETETTDRYVSSHKARGQKKGDRSYDAVALAQILNVSVDCIEAVGNRLEGYDNADLINQVWQQDGPLYAAVQLHHNSRRPASPPRAAEHRAPSYTPSVGSTSRVPPADLNKQTCLAIAYNLEPSGMDDFLSSMSNALCVGYPDGTALFAMPYTEAKTAVKEYDEFAVASVYLARNLWSCVKPGTPGYNILKRLMSGNLFDGAKMLFELRKMMAGDASAREVGSKKFESASFFRKNMNEGEVVIGLQECLRAFAVTTHPQDEYSTLLAVTGKIPSIGENSIYDRVKEDLEHKIHVARRENKPPITEKQLESELVTLLRERSSREANGARGNPRATGGGDRVREQDDGQRTNQRGSAEWTLGATCNRCGKVGHIAFKCTEENCRRCNKRNCPGRLPGQKCVVKSEQPVPRRVVSGVGFLPDPMREVLVKANLKHRGLGDSSKKVNTAENEDGEDETAYDTDNDEEFVEWGRRAAQKKKLSHANVAVAKRRQH